MKILTSNGLNEVTKTYNLKSNLKSFNNSGFAILLFILIYFIYNNINFKRKNF